MAAKTLSVVVPAYDEALNIRPVAQRLGVSPRLLYHHVRDKEAMLALLTWPNSPHAVCPPSRYASCHAHAPSTS